MFHAGSRGDFQSTLRELTEKDNKASLTACNNLAELKYREASRMRDHGLRSPSAMFNIALPTITRNKSLNKHRGCSSLEIDVEQKQHCIRSHFGSSSEEKIFSIWDRGEKLIASNNFSSSEHFALCFAGNELLYPISPRCVRSDKAETMKTLRLRERSMSFVDFSSHEADRWCSTCHSSITNRASSDRFSEFTMYAVDWSPQQQQRGKVIRLVSAWLAGGDLISR